MRRYTPRWPVQWVPNTNYPQGQAGATDVLMKALCIHIRQCDGTWTLRRVLSFMQLISVHEYHKRNVMWYPMKQYKPVVFYFGPLHMTWRVKPKYRSEPFRHGAMHVLNLSGMASLFADLLNISYTVSGLHSSIGREENFRRVLLDGLQVYSERYCGQQRRFLQMIENSI